MKLQTILTTMAAVSVGSFLLGGCHQLEVDALRPSAPRSVILVTIDTLRADHLGAYGYAADTSPNFDALAKESILFEHAISSCSATAPATASILTGLYRASHGVGRNGSVMPDKGVETIAEIFKSQGYHTAGLIGNPAIGAELGFDQGFDEFGMPEGFNQSGPGRFGGQPMVDHAIRILEERAAEDKLVFMWVHFMDPHGPYFPPENVRTMFPDEDYVEASDKPLSLSKHNYALGGIPRYQSLEGQQPGDMLAPAPFRANYDAEIRNVDDNLGRLIEALHSHGFWDDTVLAITADHGEGLGEHNFFFQHGWYLYEDEVRVPLLIRVPGLSKPIRIPQTISMVDFAPTLLELSGHSPGASMEGGSVLSLLKGKGQGRSAYSQTYYGNQLTSLSRGNFKYILTPPPPGPGEDDRKWDGWKKHWPTEVSEELYDLRVDPGELNNLVGSQGTLLVSMRGELRDWMEDQHERNESLSSQLVNDKKHAKQLRKMERDIRLEEQLRALGYLE